MMNIYIVISGKYTRPLLQVSEAQNYIDDNVV